MSNLPPILRDQRKIDADHLKLLSIFHFVCAGLSLFGLLFLFAHFLMFHAIFSNPQMWQSQKLGPPPEVFAMLKWLYLFFGVWILVSGVLNVFSGMWLGGRKHRTFSMVVAGVNCLHLPLGTALGVFTIIVLLRDSVRETYETSPNAGGGRL